MPVSIPGRDDRTPADGRSRSWPGNGVRRSALEPSSGGVPDPNVPGSGVLGGIFPAVLDPGVSGENDARVGRAAEGSGSSLVRPYAVTGGRTKPRYQLEIEAMVAASHYEARDLSVLSPECQAILGFCRDWRSVAEVSAGRRVPLGVARIPPPLTALAAPFPHPPLGHAPGLPR